MTDPDRLPEHEEAVRRLLADARHDEPAPAEVVARLDDVLADLTAERRRAAPVVELGAARRRRRAASLVLAAAAVVAVGVGLDQVMSGVGQDASTSSTAGDADSETFRDPSESGGSTDDGAEGQPAPRTVVPPTAVVALASDTLDADLLRVRRVALGADAVASVETCVVPGDGDRVAVTLDGEAGVAVFRDPRAGRQRVDVFVCGEAEPARSVRLPAP